MTPEEATARLEQLEACAAEGQRRYSEALAATRVAQQTGAEVAGPLAAYHAEVLHRQRDADGDEARRLTLEVLLRITDDGLLLEPLDPTVPARGLRVVDPGPARALEDASSAADAARAERDTFFQGRGRGPTGGGRCAEEDGPRPRCARRREPGRAS